jgi:hypothetical protein
MWSGLLQYSYQRWWIIPKLRYMLKTRFGLRADAWNDGPAAEHLLYRASCLLWSRAAVQLRR